MGDWLGNDLLCCALSSLLVASPLVVGTTGIKRVGELSGISFSKRSYTAQTPFTIRHLTCSGNSQPRLPLSRLTPSYRQPAYATSQQHPDNGTFSFFPFSLTLLIPHSPTPLHPNPTQPNTAHGAREKADQAFFLPAAAAALAAFLRLLRIMTTLRKEPTTAQPSSTRITGRRIAQTRGGKKFWRGWSESTKGCLHVVS